MRTLFVLATLLAATLAAPSGLLHAPVHAAVPAATFLSAAPYELKEVEVETTPVKVEYAAAPVPHGYAAPIYRGYAPAVHAAPVEVKAVEVEVEEAPAPVLHHAPVHYAAHAVAPVTTVEAKIGAPVAVRAGPTQVRTHYQTVPQVTGYTSTIHKPAVVAPRIGVPTTLLNRVEHQPAEVTVEKYDVNVQQVEPNPVPYKVPVAGAPIYDNTHIKHEPVIRTHTAVHRTAVAAPVYHAAPVHHGYHAAPAYAAPGYAAHAAPAYGVHAAPAFHAAPLHHGLPLTYAAAEEAAVEEAAE